MDDRLMYYVSRFTLIMKKLMNLLLVFMFLLPWTWSPSVQSATKDQITLGISQEPDSLDPLLGEMAASSEILGAILRGLTVRNEKWELLPDLAKEIPSLANGLWEQLPDNKMRTTWHLKEGVKWQDGQPVTAEDFIFAHQVTMDDRIPVISRDLDRRIEKIEAPDLLTLIVTWKELYAYANEGHALLPKHLLEPIYQADPTKYNESFFNTKPVGNGPYTLTEWEPGNYLILEKNPTFFGEPPRFNKIIYRIIPDTNTLLANLESRTVDAVSPTGPTFDQALDFQKRKGNAFNVTFVPGLVWEHIDMNHDSPILKDKRVRQALLYAIDREKMVQALFESKQEVAHTWLPPRHYGYSSDVRKYPYDLEKAKGLLEEASWKEGPDGIRINAQGEKLRLTIMTTSGNKVRERVEEILQADWKKAGIDLEIKNQPAKVFFGETVRQRKYPHLAMYAWIISPTSDGESLWTIKNIPSPENSWQGQNSGGFRHLEMDRIDTLVPRTLDEKERQSLLAQEQKIWTEELPALPLYFRVDVSATRKDLVNWLVTGTDTPVTWNAERWYFAK
jgi:peptide/nickel transport system substrate-binding protein